MRTSRALLLVLGAALAGGGGCASAPKPKPEPSFEVPVADYARTFTATKDVLREAGFALDRVDSERGVITTRPRASSGLITPWIDHATTPGDAMAGVMHRERRLVEVTFVSDEGSELPPDSRPIIATVEVTVQRLGAPGRKADATSIRLTSRWTEGQGAASQTNWTPYSTMVERPDEKLSVRLAEAIREKSDVPPMEPEPEALSPAEGAPPDAEETP